MNRGPTVAQSLPVDRYAGNCLIKPSSYYCGTGGGGVHCNNAALEPSRGRYDAVVGAAAVGYHNHGGQPATTPYQHYQQLQDWYGRTAYWHHHHHHQNHHNQQHHQNGGGGPSAEKANFAAHKHGVPLIQAAKYNRTSGGCGGGGGGVGGGPGKKYAKKAPAEQPNKKNDGGSDESSGAASENSLPRIIKPRKRRKKERKPVPAALAAMPPLVVAAQDRSSPSPSPSPPPTSPSQHQQQQPQQLQHHSAQPPQEDVFGPFDTIRLSADIKAVSLEDVSTCQCACCDPVGNVWDVGRRCFSPSLTRPEPARRSWSGEPSSPLSTSSSSSFFKTAVEYAKPEIVAPPRVRTHSLEVSSEIVTSHNGHRDIEIKFFTMPIGNH